MLQMKETRMKLLVILFLLKLYASINKSDKNSGTMGKWVVDYFQNVSSLLSQITTYRENNIRLHWQAHIDLLPLLFAFSHQKYGRSLTQLYVELTNLSIAKPKTFLIQKPLVLEPALAELIFRLF